jgi:hypothetical protein
MSENINELFELEELKATYKLMDERLDNQEIVSNEQLRETMVRKFTDMRQNLKEGIIWGNLLFVPVFAWHLWATSRLTLLGMVMLAVYWVASLVFRFVILRRTKKEDYGGYDLKTMVEKEASYAKHVKWGSVVMLIFWVAFLVQLFWGRDQTEWFIFGIMLMTLLMSITYRKLVIKYKYNGQNIDPATGSPRVLGGKWFTIPMYILIGLAACLFLYIFVMTFINISGLEGWLRGINISAHLVAVTIMVLGTLHHRNKITVSRRLLIILAVIAITMAATVVGIGILQDIAEFTQSTSLLMVVCLSGLGLSCHKMRK